MSFPIGFPGDFGRRDLGRSGTAVMELPRPHEVDPVDQLTRRRRSIDPTLCPPGRATVDRWLADRRWVEFSTGGDLPAHWSAGTSDIRCDNCGAFASSLCSMACPGRRLTSITGRLAVQVPCESRHHEDAADGVACPRCDDGLVTVAWATTEFGPLRVVDYRYRLRRSKPNQFELADGTYHDLTSDIEPICLPGRWARGGTISIERP